MIVSNTTPISNFLHLGQMEILKTIFKELHVPMAVYSEIEAYFSGDNQLVIPTFAFNGTAPKSIQIVVGPKPAICFSLF